MTETISSRLGDEPSRALRMALRRAVPGIASAIATTALRHGISLRDFADGMESAPLNMPEGASSLAAAEVVLLITAALREASPPTTN